MRRLFAMGERMEKLYYDSVIFYASDELVSSQFSCSIASLVNL